MIQKDSIGDRMKNNYENRYRIYLTRRTPVIIRLDGRAFHTVTRNINKPFSEMFNSVMLQVMLYLMKNIQGCKLGYMQSDEISLLLTDYNTLTTEAWFDYNLQKMVSVSAAMATAEFNKQILDKVYSGDEEALKILNPGNAVFDSRAFNLPREEVCNYFIWRQKDWLRNSIQMYCRAHFSHSELEGKDTADMHEMLHSKGLNWAKDLPPKFKNGTVFLPHNGDMHYIFTENQEWVSDLLLDIEEYSAKYHLHESDNGSVDGKPASNFSE